MTPATSAQAITPSAPPPGEEVPAYVLELERAAAYLPAEQLPLLRQAWRVGAAGHAVATDEPVDDIAVSNLGFQVRYRYELAPLSYLYVVYGRGGDMFNEYWQSSGSLLGDAFSLRDSEQLVVKFSYRFEL